MVLCVSLYIVCLCSWNVCVMYVKFFEWLVNSRLFGFMSGLKCDSICFCVGLLK